MKKPGNTYINNSVEYCNKFQKRKILEKKLAKESKLVNKDSLVVLKEFEELDFKDQSIWDLDCDIERLTLIKKIGDLPINLVEIVKENIRIIFDIE